VDLGFYSGRNCIVFSFVFATSHIPNNISGLYAVGAEGTGSVSIVVQWKTSSKRCCMANGYSLEQGQLNRRSSLKR